MNLNELKDVTKMIYDEFGNFSLSYSNGIMNFFCTGDIKDKEKQKVK